jgi:hypothetical protein
VKNSICPNLKPGENPSLGKKIIAAAITGVVAIFFANPFVSTNKYNMYVGCGKG